MTSYRIKDVKVKYNSVKKIKGVRVNKATDIAIQTKKFECMFCKSPVVSYKKTGDVSYGFVCANGELLTLEHIIPKALGGADYVENYGVSCESCNSDKGCNPHVGEQVVVIRSFIKALKKSKKKKMIGAHLVDKVIDLFYKNPSSINVAFAKDFPSIIDEITGAPHYKYHPVFREAEKYIKKHNLKVYAPA